MLQQRIDARTRSGNVCNFSRKTDGLQMPSEAFRILAAAQAEPNGQPKCQGHAERHTFTMKQPRREPGRRFQRVTECVTQIEQGTVTRLAFVARHDGGLHATGVCDRMHGGRRVAGQHVGAVRFQPFEKHRIAQRAVFHCLRITCQQLATRQRRERAGVCNHNFRLMEYADEVLAFRGIDRRLSAYG